MMTILPKGVLFRSIGKAHICREPVGMAAVFGILRTGGSEGVAQAFDVRCWAQYHAGFAGLLHQKRLMAEQESWVVFWVRCN
jgi:hypothetical protein